MARPRGSKNKEPYQRVTAAELEREGYVFPKALDKLEGNSETAPVIAEHIKGLPVNTFIPNNVAPRRILGELIRSIGAETIDPRTGWTRVEVLVRSLYAKAMSGDVAAAREILDRGWGRVPTPVELDLTGQMQQLINESGLSTQDVAKDPLLSMLFSLTGVLDATVNGQRPRFLENAGGPDERGAGRTIEDAPPADRGREGEGSAGQ